MDWTELWDIVRDIVLPHLGRLIFTVSFFTVLGIIISIVLLIVYGKKKILKRRSKVYTIIIRFIYIPGIVLTCIICGFQFGLARGVYKIIKIENNQVVNAIYLGTVEQYFSNEQAKEEFLTEIKSLAQRAQIANTEYSYALEQSFSSQMNNSNLDSASAYIVKKYNDEVYSAILYGLCYAADFKFDEKLNYSDFNNVIDVLMKTDVAKVEKSIKFVMAQELQEICYSQYKSIVLPMLLIWILVLCIPLIEFIIYKMLFEQKPQEIKPSGENLKPI